MNQLFISYSRKDYDAVSAMAEKLRSEGIDVWLDISGAGTGIPFSTKWFDVIEEALHMAGGAIIVKSESWENSVPCSKEWNIIKKCDIPYLEITPQSIREDLDAAHMRIRQFIKEKVTVKENDYRTILFASSYEIKSGVNPNRLAKNTKSFFASFFHTIIEYRAYKKLIKRRQYAALNPELFPYIKKYLHSLVRTLLFKTTGVIAVLLTVMTAIILIRAIPMALEQGSEQNKNTYYGQYAAARISDSKEFDPVNAINMAEGLDEKYLSVTSYGSLCISGAQLLDARLPEKVLTAQDEEYDEIKSAALYETSPLYTAEPLSNSGGITVTEIGTGKKRTLNTVSEAEHIVWNSGGNIAAFSAGAKVYLYDAVGMGMPILLSENYERISQLKILDLEEDLFVAAFTDRDTVVLWRSPFADRANRIRTTKYGVFLESDEPTAVYIDGKDIVINRNNNEQVISPDIPDAYGVIRTPYYSVTPDGSKIAFICKNDDKTRILCMDLINNKILIDIPSDYTATSVTFSTNGEDLYASANQCAIIHIHIASGAVEYGQYSDLYFANIAPYGDRYLLTDYYGNCCIFDGTVLTSDLGAFNYAFMPCFSMAVNSEDGYLFTVNRGAGTTVGCSRFDLNTGAMHLFIVPETPGVDANTSVALSKDGKYVAFGYPNGMIRVYEQKNMYLIFESVCIGEPVSSIRFDTDDSTLYILGSTGKMYSCDLPKLVLSEDLSSMKSNWETMVRALSDKKRTYYSGVSATVGQ